MSTPGPQGQSGMSNDGLDRTVGALFFATVLSMGLWGIGTIQLYFYFNNYSKDSRWLKIYIYAVWFLDTSHQALLIGMIHRYTIMGFGDYDGLMQLDPLLISAFLVGAIICAMVQLMFLMRIWRLSERNLFIAIFIGSLVLAQFGTACLYFVKAIQSQTFARLMSAMTITRIVNSVTAAADTAIAVCLVVLLHRTRSGFKQSDTTINRLIMFTINTGLVTSLCAVIGLVLGFVLLETLLFMVFYLMIARLYTNSLLAALNSRNSLRRSLTKGSTNVKMSNRTTIFKTITTERHFDEYPPPTSAVPRERGELDTAATQATVMLDTTVDSPNAIDTFYSRSMYSVDLEDFQKVPSGETTPTKAQINRSTDNWI